MSHAVPVAAVGRPRRTPRLSCDTRDPQRRIAWLLRTNRLYGEDEQWVRAAAFVRGFRGGSWPQAVSEFQISRWETASSKAPYQAIRRYEEVLGLRPGMLVAAADNAYRSASGVAGVRVLDRGINPASVAAHEVTDELLDRADGNDVMSGYDWDRLTSHLVAFPDAFVPRPTLTSVAQRLLSEQLVARGVAWFQRYESYNRLLGHRRVQPAAVSACAAVAADPSSQVRIEPLSVLDACDHPDAARLVLRELANPSNVNSTFGALLAAVRKTQLGHFSAEQIARLQVSLLELVHDPTLRSQVHALAVELLRQLPHYRENGLARQLGRVLATDATLSQVLNVGRIMAPDAGRVIVMRIANRAIAGLARDISGFEDDVLPEVIDDALHNANYDIRLAADQQLAASPYRRALACAVMEELRNRDALFDQDRTPALLDLLGFVSRPEDRRLVERLATATGLPPVAMSAAARALGRFAGTSSERYLRSAMEQHTRVWRHTRDPLREVVLRHLVYAFGVVRNDGLLRETAKDTDLPASTRQAATWWMNVPDLIERSALM